MSGVFKCFHSLSAVVSDRLPSYQRLVCLKINYQPCPYHVLASHNLRQLVEAPLLQAPYLQVTLDSLTLKPGFSRVYRRDLLLGSGSAFGNIAYGAASRIHQQPYHPVGFPWSFGRWFPQVGGIVLLISQSPAGLSTFTDGIRPILLCQTFELV